MIRAGVVDDLGRIAEMAGEFWSNTSFDEPYDSEFVELMAAECIKQKLLVVLDIDGHVCGFCCGVKGPLLASPEATIGTEVAWWVDPEHRSGRNGIGLLRGIEEAARNAGCKYWVMIFMESSMPDSIEGIYKKMNYSKSETSYIKRVL